MEGARARDRERGSETEIAGRAVWDWVSLGAVLSLLGFLGPLGLGCLQAHMQLMLRCCTYTHTTTTLGWASLDAVWRGDAGGPQAGCVWS